MRSALFVEREDVLIAPGWRAPDEVRLLPGVAAAVRRLNLAGVAVAAVCDRWLLAPERDEAAFAASQERVAALLAAGQARLDGVWRAARGETGAVKPRPTLLLAAAKALGVDLARSWLVGAGGDDAVAAAQAGCAGAVLVAGDPPAGDLGIVVARADSLADAPRVMVTRDGGCWHER